MLGCAAAVRVVLEAVCILKGIKPVRFKDPQSGQMVDSYWEASKKMLMDEDFLPSLRSYITGISTYHPGHCCRSTDVVQVAHCW
jgi:hypothetical protein